MSKQTLSNLELEILGLIKQYPGQLTERELAERLYAGKPHGGVQQNVNGPCRKLCRLGLIKRAGKGGNKEPYRYFIV